MFNLERAYFILEEMVLNGNIVDTNKFNALNSLYFTGNHHLNKKFIRQTGNMLYKLFMSTINFNMSLISVLIPLSH